MKDKDKVFLPVLAYLTLILFGFAIALGLAEMLLRAFPNSLPPEVRVNPPARRVKSFVDEVFDLRQSDGDLYYLMKGKIVPLSPAEDQIVAHVHMITDAYGFRNSPPEKNTYHIVALGDSFTRASGVPSAWPQELAERTESDVLNLGDLGFGPQDELQVLRQYGLKKQPQWVILAYFEGNDLYDAASYAQASPFILPRFGKYIVERGLDTFQDKRQDDANARVERTYRYPITVTINDRGLQMAFFSYYIAWLSVSRDVIAASQNYSLVEDTMLAARDLSEASGARFLLVYVPSKEHVYLPYLNDDDLRARVFADVPIMELDQAGFFQFTGKHVTPELTSQYIDDQASLLAEFAAQQNMDYLDLTTIFQEEARSGFELYYPFDTHWNQRGHNLAARAIADYLQMAP